VGLNVTVMRQLPPAATVAGQLLDWAKSPGLGPVRVTPMMSSCALPTLVSFTVFGRLVVPTVRRTRKDTLVGVRLTAGWPPEPPLPQSASSSGRWAYEDDRFYRVSKERVRSSGSGRARREHSRPPTRQRDCQDRSGRADRSQTGVEAAWAASGRGGGCAQQGCSPRKGVITLNVFLDSSALAKRYVDEPGSDRLEEILAWASSLGISVIGVPETVSALCRRRRERKLSQSQYSKAKRAL
jgi:hypothetical protein